MDVESSLYWIQFQKIQPILITDDKNIFRTTKDKTK